MNFISVLAILVSRLFSTQALRFYTPDVHGGGGGGGGYGNVAIHKLYVRVATNLQQVTKKHTVYKSFLIFVLHQTSTSQQSVTNIGGGGDYKSGPSGFV